MARTIRLAAVLTLGVPLAQAQTGPDPSLAAFVASIRAVDNHTHVRSTAPEDPDTDALPLDGLPEFLLPVRLRPESPQWLEAYRALYGYRHDDLSEPHRSELRATMRRVRLEQGERFPEWVLDKIGTEVMLANRVAMGPGLHPPRFLWASYADALLLPLSTKAEAAATPDAAALYPLEAKLLGRYLSDLGLGRPPGTLDDYLRKVVTATLERQRRGGCVAVKFEAAYLRRLDFDAADEEAARGVYARYVAGGEPSHAEYKTLQDFLFRHVAREAGRLGMAVHIHSFEGAGGFYSVAGSDPLLLEPALNDPTLRGTSFVIVHGGGVFAAHTGALLAKPNVYADFSVMPLFYPSETLAGILRGWLTQYPEKVLFGTDAFGSGPDADWELAAWIASTAGRRALVLALTTMQRDDEISASAAQDIARMVLRGNAARLYKLPLR